jgi:hypothetical protein
MKLQNLGMSCFHDCNSSVFDADARSANNQFAPTNGRSHDHCVSYD